MSHDEVGLSIVEPHIDDNDAGRNVDANVNDSVPPPSEEAVASVRFDEHGALITSMSYRAKLDDLIRALDSIVWVEIAIVYYLDNSFLRFFLRSMIQMVYLVPQTPAFPALQTLPYVGGIIVINVLCMALHIIFPCPKAGDATRGYLHGGLLLDFVGQQGPTSKPHLVVLDLIIVCVQLMALAVTVKKKDMAKLEQKIKSRSSFGSSTAERSSLSETVAGEMDAEERGEPRWLALFDALPLQDSVSFLARGAPVGDQYWAFADLWTSGQGIIAELFIIDTIRIQHNAYQESRVATGANTGRFNLGHELRLPFRS